ncbi:MAG: hypothetical protein LQ337_008635 [Flavoplaca oasis]|nr:MAG: hypothetical protein LQ337_008635 [Flavoplaca oasis]
MSRGDGDGGSCRNRLQRDATYIGDHSESLTPAADHIGDTWKSRRGGEVDPSIESRKRSSTDPSSKIFTFLPTHFLHRHHNTVSPSNNLSGASANQDHDREADNTEYDMNNAHASDTDRRSSPLLSSTKKSIQSSEDPSYFNSSDQRLVEPGENVLNRPDTTAMSLTSGITKSNHRPTKQTTALNRKQYLRLQQKASPAPQDRSKTDGSSSILYGTLELHNQEEPAMSSGQLGGLGCMSVANQLRGHASAGAVTYLDEGVILV